MAGQMGWPKMDWPKLDWPKSALTPAEGVQRRGPAVGEVQRKGSSGGFEVWGLGFRVQGSRQRILGTKTERKLSKMRKKKKKNQKKKKKREKERRKQEKAEKEKTEQTQFFDTRSILRTVCMLARVGVSNKLSVLRFSGAILSFLAS